MKNNIKKLIKKKKGISPQTWIFTIMALMALCIGSAMRFALSITITEMTIVKRYDDQSKEIGSIRFDWNEHIQVSFYFD